MRQFFYFLFILLFASCAKDSGTPAPVGGDLPTNYVNVRENMFDPASLVLVAGNSITFVNQTSTPKTIITTDTITIRRTTIPANKSFVFKKDTTGTFFYYNVDKPSVGGSFRLNP